MMQTGQINRKLQSDRLKSMAFERLREWEDNGLPRGRITLICDHDGYVQDVLEQVSVAHFKPKKAK